MAYDIHDFIRDGLAKGASKADLGAALRKEGWPEDEVTSGLALFGDSSVSGLPVPRRKPYVSAKEAFTYLVMFVTLYISAFNFGALLFQFIERWLPDPLQTYYDGGSAIRFALASLIVAFPIYFWLTLSTRKSLAKDPTKQQSKVRKWLTNLTLVVAAFVIIGDAIALVVNLLGGELTMRFILKVGVVGLIAGLIFGYYRWDLNHDEKQV
jgi:hypothetical protein